MFARPARWVFLTTMENAKLVRLLVRNVVLPSPDVPLVLPDIISRKTTRVPTVLPRRDVMLTT